MFTDFVIIIKDEKLISFNKNQRHVHGLYSLAITRTEDTTQTVNNKLVFNE